ncbi:protein FAR1-RELATED SEQUENCE 11-like [Vicia villosa]|uniref:protein FAR1-RELATED SEQUENCE 11-like n=1 Tax=Vicia villosa TaxID=3911 RepID=UPI00273B619C|nr:protein FAR1-RELATED SEQUENCE 11-like [Vicia villosa]
MPFGIFVGVDNHGRTILFGCTLIRNETVSTFQWLMKTFVILMKKPPKTIITDQDPWRTQAIAFEMSSTKHAFCIWHITPKFSGWFTSILRNRYSSWCADFYKLYKLDNIDDFEEEWFIIVSKYNLEANKHIKGLYEVKQYWVDLAIEDIGQQLLHHTMLDTYRGSLLRSLSPLEEKVHNIFTKFAFTKFQKEFERATQYKICEEKRVEFIVNYYNEKQSQKHKVLWDGDVVGCSCKHFEFWGILCSHILAIFLHKDCFQIPIRYLPLRWCQDEFQRPVEVNMLSERGHKGKGPSIENAVEFIKNPPCSITKGRPKTKRSKGGIKLSTKARSCTLCKRTGHNFTTCPDKEGYVQSSNTKKRKNESQAQQNLNPVFYLKS